MHKLIMIGLIILLMLGCKHYPDNYQPKDLEDALSYLDYSWDKSNKEKFKNTPEDSAVAMLHFGIGMQMRNDWNLWSGDNLLSKYFNSIGIFHPDDMSSILFTSLHRQLNNKDIDLNGQIKFYKNYWSEIDKREAKRKQHAERDYNQYDIGDNIMVCMFVDTFMQELRAVGMSNTDWIINPDKDLMINCKLIDKFVNKDSAFFFKVKINDMNRFGIPTIYEVLKIGDILDVEISYFKIKK